MLNEGLLLLLLLLLLLRPRPAAKEERAVGLEGADVAERAGLRRAGALGGRVGRDDALAARALPSTQHSTASSRARAGRSGKLKQRRVVLVLEAHALVRFVFRHGEARLLEDGRLALHLTRVKRAAPHWRMRR